MSKLTDVGVGVVDTVADVVAIPYNLVAGLALGIIAPIAGIAAAIAGVRLLTGKMPMLSMQQEPGQECSLLLTLVPPEQAGEMFAAQKEQIGGEISHMQSEIRAIVEEAKAEAKRTSPQPQGPWAPEDPDEFIPRSAG